MADNVNVPGSGSVAVRSKSLTGVETQIVQLDVGGESAESLVSAANPLPTTTPTPSSLVVGQYKLTAAAVQVGTGALVNGITIKAKTTNAAEVWVGGSGVTKTDDGTGNGFALNGGDTVSVACSNVNAVYAIGTAGDVLYFVGN